MQGKRRRGGRRCGLRKRKNWPVATVGPTANQQKELATMARHGHDYGLARKIVTAESAAMLAEEAQN